MSNNGREPNKLSEPVLVLNKGFQAIHVIVAKKAISLLYQDVAEAVDETFNYHPFDIWCMLSAQDNGSNHNYNHLHSSTLTVRIPHVIRLIKYDKLPLRDLMFNRKNIYARDRNQCQYCGQHFKQEELTFDHVVPKCKGGKNSFENVVTCCVTCNHSKGDRTPSEARMRLVQRPVKPRWRSFVKVPFSRLKPVKTRLWQEFLKKPYWELAK